MEVPVIDLSRYLEIANELSDDPEKLSGQIGEAGPWLKELCQEVSRILRETGALIVKDPRCTAEDNDRFIDMMEKYFEKPVEFKRLQERPQLHYQVGVTPEGVEVPRSLVDEEIQESLKGMPVECQPLIPSGPDRKWRYMWRIGPRPSNTRFKELNSEPVIPEGFTEWKDTMDSWGYKMVSAVEAVAEMAAIGCGLPKDAFTSLMKQGPHLLAPTGSDLSQYCQEGTVFAGYHYDLNFLTIHGRSRFPGLNIWLRNGQKVGVKVPLGCLLIQTGKQIEWLTAGDCIAGMHEVVVTQRTIDAIRLALEQNRSLWRKKSFNSHDYNLHCSPKMAHLRFPSSILPLFLVALSMTSCQIVQVEARHLLETGFPTIPELPKPDLPTTEAPELPKPTVPEVPKPEVSELPKPTVPEIPKPEVPELPKHTVPEVPTMPKPEVPEHPKHTVPEFPTLPTPKVPELPEHTAPEVPTLPTPEVPDIPKPIAPKVPTLPEHEVPEPPKHTVPQVPELPKLTIPEVPPLPKHEVPELPKHTVPEVPALPKHEVPELPKPIIPKMPTLPKLEVPELPKHEMPKVPKLPELPPFVHLP